MRRVRFYQAVVMNGTRWLLSLTDLWAKILVLVVLLGGPAAVVIQLHWAPTLVVVVAAAVVLVIFIAEGAYRTWRVAQDGLDKVGEALQATIKQRDDLLAAQIAQQRLSGGLRIGTLDARNNGTVVDMPHGANVAIEKGNLQGNTRGFVVRSPLPDSSSPPEPPA